MFKEKFIKQLTKEFSRSKFIGRAYSTDEEMLEHFLSGEVTIPISRVISIIDKIDEEHTSEHKINDRVDLVFEDQGLISGCTVIKVHFTNSKVLYDVNVDALRTRIYNVDSRYVLPRNDGSAHLNSEATRPLNSF